MNRTTVKVWEPSPKAQRIGATIREMRVLSGFSQDELASAAQISRPYLSSIEAGRYVPSRRAAARIARAMGVKLVSILPRDDSEVEAA